MKNMNAIRILIREIAIQKVSISIDLNFKNCFQFIFL